jgi:hypothetical protein
MPRQVTKIARNDESCLCFWYDQAATRLVSVTYGTVQLTVKSTTTVPVPVPVPVASGSPGSGTKFRESTVPFSKFQQRGNAPDDSNSNTVMKGEDTTAKRNGAERKRIIT